MPDYQEIHIPSSGERITSDENGHLNVPDHPIIPVIEGDGVGRDITPVMRHVLDATVAKSYHGQRALCWMDVYAGEQAVARYGPDQWLPEETLEALQHFCVSIKGPLGTPVGGGIRSLNVAIRQRLDLYACVRPIRYFPGILSPLRQPEKTDMIIFRENTEDIYMGLEWAAGSAESAKISDFLQQQLAVHLPHPKTTGIGIKPISRQGSERLIDMAIRHAIAKDRSSVTLVHKGNIMKHTEGAFRHWGYQWVQQHYGGQEIDGGPWCAIKNPNSGKDIIIKDLIADNFLQQILLKPELYDVIATMNLNGDYISDALAAQVGGIGMAPGANIGHGVAVFEATHGTAPKHAGKNRINPGSEILSGEMMLRHLGWHEAADLLQQAMQRTLAAGHMTYDLACAEDGQTRSGVTLLSCSDFGQALIAQMA